METGEHLQVLGITEEEWEGLNYPKLIVKFTAAKKGVEKQKLPSSVKEKLVLTINESYDILRSAIVNKNKTLRREEEEDDKASSGGINYRSLETRVNLPLGLLNIGRMKPTELPMPRKYLDKGVVLNPDTVKIPLENDELVIPVNKLYGDMLVYTDLTYIALLEIVRC